MQYQNKPIKTKKIMRKKELWMKKGAVVRALGKLGTIVKMQENELNGIDYVYYITVKVDGKNGTYHPNDVEKAE